MMNRHERRKNAKKLIKMVDTMIAKRPCGECSACCVTLDIRATASPVGHSCRHISPNGGCSIYSSRPGECREYACAWKFGFGTEEERPDKVGYTITAGRREIGLHPCWLVHELVPGATKTPKAEAFFQRLANPNVVAVMRDARAIAKLYFPEDRAEEVRRFVAEATVDNGAIREAGRRSV